MQACKCLQMPRLTQGETRSPCTITKYYKNYILTQMYNHNHHPQAYTAQPPLILLLKPSIHLYLALPAHDPHDPP